MEQIMLHKEEENKQKGMIVSFVVHALLLLLCLIPYISKEEKPEPISGIMVTFGNPDSGASDVPPESNNTEQPTESKPVEKTSSDNAKSSTATKQEQNATKPKETNAPINDITPIAEDSPLVAEDAQKEQAEANAQAAEDERLRQQAEEIARQEAQKKAEEEARKAALEASKSNFSDLLGNGTGNNNNTGNQGNPNGDPNSSALDQIATGSGRIGGGISDRGVIFEPEINDNSQRTGKVVIKVCVDKNGKVSEAKFTQGGSTTTDKYLADIATKAAKQYQFTPSDVETQCGNITIEFKVK